MGIHLCVLLFLQIICYSSIEAFPEGSKSSMLNKILSDPRVSQSSILPIWQQEPSRSCNIEKPPEKSLTEPTFLQFGFVQYLCVILYDASLRYLNISHASKEGNPVIVQKIIEESSPVNTFCQRMRVNNWNTTIEENKRWVSNFNDHMKNGSCQRYCVSGDVLNPLCAFALWIDSAVKLSQAEHLLPAKVHEQSPVHVPSVFKPKVNPAETNAKKPHTEIIGAQVPKHELGVEGKREHSTIILERQDPDVEISTQHKDPSLAGNNHGNAPPHINPLPDINPPPPIAGQISNIADAQANMPYLMQRPPLHVDGTGEYEHVGNNPGNPDHAETGRFPPPIDGSSPALKNHANMGKTSIPSDILGHAVMVPKVVNPVKVEGIPLPLTTASQKVTKPETENRTAGGQPLHLEQSDTTSVVSTSHKVEDSAQGLTGPNAETAPTDQQGGHDRGGESHVPITVNDGSVGGSVTANGDQDTPPKNVPSADSPLVPEPSKKTEPSEDKTEKEKMNTTAPVTKEKEEPGNNKADTAAQLGKSDTEDANQANEGGADNAAIGGEPSNHEEQKDMDDVEAISQGDDGDTGVRGGGFPPQEAEQDPSDQRDYTAAHRFGDLEDDDEAPPKPGASSPKLASDYGSDEADGTWLQGQQEKGSQNDADGGYAHDRFVDAEESHFFAYFMTMIILCILGYLIFHNKQKILALALEGRVRKGSRRRPSTSGYRKLDSNLEEAVTSSCTGSSVTHVIY